jgi:uncharacterized membrane protein
VAIFYPLILLLHLLTPFLFTVNDIFTDVFCLCIALPTMVDWTSQRLALRESTNQIRFSTAFIAGFSLDWYLLSRVHILHKTIFLFFIFAFIVFFASIDRRPQHSENATEEPDPEPDTEASS